MATAGGMEGLRAATRCALRARGLDSLRDPRRFVALVSDELGPDSREMGILYRTYDMGYLATFADAAGSWEGLRDAAERAALRLTDELATEPGAARRVMYGIALGVADFMGHAPSAGPAGRGPAAQGPTAQAATGREPAQGQGGRGQADRSAPQAQPVRTAQAAPDVQVAQQPAAQPVRTARPIAQQPAPQAQPAQAAQAAPVAQATPPKARRRCRTAAADPAPHRLVGRSPSPHLESHAALGRRHFDGRRFHGRDHG